MAFNVRNKFIKEYCGQKDLRSEKDYSDQYATTKIKNQFYSKTP